LFLLFLILVFFFVFYKIKNTKIKNKKNTKVKNTAKCSASCLFSFIWCVAKMQCYLFDLCVFDFIKNNKNKAIALQKFIFASGHFCTRCIPHLFCREFTFYMK